MAIKFLRERSKLNNFLERHIQHFWRCRKKVENTPFSGRILSLRICKFQKNIRYFIEILVMSTELLSIFWFPYQDL